MAQYTQKLYAIDSYAVDGYGNKVVGSTLTTEIKYDFYVSTDERADLHKHIHITFPADYQRFDKKREVGANEYIYVRTKRTYNKTIDLHPFPNNGRFVHGFIKSDYSLYFNMNADFLIELKDIPTYAYTNIIGNLDKNKCFLGVGCGTNQGKLWAGDRYECSCSCEIDSHTGANPPYLLITYEDVVPFASNRFPSNFLDKKVTNTFTWQFDYDKENITGMIRQTSAILRYREKGAPNYIQVNIEGQANTYSVPPNTFSSDRAEWQVVVTSDDGIVSTQSDWIELTTIDNFPSCDVVYPNDIYIDGTKPNTFYWEHIVDTGSPQTKYDLQYSIDGTDWIDIISEKTARQNYTVPKDTFPAGALYWRVRTYNTDNVVSAWSAVGNLVCRSSPPAPNIISIDNKSRPTIQWGATDQEAFNLIIKKDGKIVHDSGTIGTKTMTYKVPVYLPDGQYDIELFVVNYYNLQSPLTKGLIVISTDKIPVVEVFHEPVKNGIKFIFKPPPNVKKLYILKNNVPIKKLTMEREWLDFSGGGETTYVIRGVDADDNYSDTEQINIDIKLKNATIAPIIDLSYMLDLKFRRDNPITNTGKVDLFYDNKQFAGRTYPVVVFSQQKTENKPLEFIFRTIEEFETFKTIFDFRATVLYRNTVGECFYGAITSYEYNRDKYGIDVSFDLQKVDFVEKIDFD